MKFDLSTIELEREDLNHLHDVFHDALDYDRKLSDKEIINYWNELPDDIKLDAVKYGCSDTPTRDAMFTYFQDKYANNDKRH